MHCQAKEKDVIGRIERRETVLKLKNTWLLTGAAALIFAGASVGYAQNAPADPAPPIPPAAPAPVNPPPAPSPAPPATVPPAGAQPVPGVSPIPVPDNNPAAPGNPAPNTPGNAGPGTGPGVAGTGVPG